MRIRWGILCALGGCSGGAPDSSLGETCSEAPRGPFVRQFAEITATSGIDFHYASTDFKGGALALADLDGDGLPDVIAGRRFGGVAMFHNRGGLRFEQVLDSGVNPDLAVQAIAVADLDNDGDPDLVLAETDVAHVMANRGDGFFTNVARFASSGRTEHVLPVDLDGDGLLDLYFSNYDLVSPARAVHLLYRNLGGLQFDARVVGRGMTWSATAFDIDGDSDQDLYLANDTLRGDFGSGTATPPEPSTLPPDQLLRNDGPGPDGILQFGDIAASVGLAAPRSSMGGVLGDFDGDGRLDLFVPNLGANKLFLKAPGGGFVENAAAFGVEAIQRTDDRCVAGTADEDCLLLHWSAVLADFDLDGYDELVVGNGVNGPGTPPVNLFVRGPETVFHEVSSELGCVDARGLVASDLDGDGDQDVLISQNNGPLLVFENRGKPAAGSWLRVQLRGRTSNREGIGAVVTARMTSGRSQVRAIGSGGVINSSSPAEAVFGLGGDTVDAIEVAWPLGKHTTIDHPAGGSLMVEEPE